MSESFATPPSPVRHARLSAWVEECIRLCRPASVHWCDGSEDENEALIGQMLADGTLHALHPEAHPGCFLHRSDISDVARVEKRTFICTTEKDDAGPINNWMSPTEAKATLTPLFDGCMAGRTMYVIPYVMGPPDSPYSKIGVEITDSAYVVASMRIMTRIGSVALEKLGQSGEFVPGLHSVGNLDPQTRYICHFPEERLIWSFGSGYGGNALLGKKCFALRIASAMARDEGWLAEHMLILELTGPEGDTHYFAGAFPSACGKTNLAMLISPIPGWSVRTVGDDIAWMHIGEDGRLWAINPEAGFFGVAPGTSEKTNPSAMATIAKNTIFTNVAVSDEGRIWWEGMGEPPAEELTDWKGNRRRVGEGEGPLAHANSRFTAPARQCPNISPRWEDPRGVPISGILLGGRRDDTLPLLMQAFSWEHGVFLGAAMASQATAAAEGKPGELRSDPMAMRPFCGYHMGDYFAHWLEMGKRIPNPPAIFHVNWFRRDRERHYLWPGYGENIRALIWMRERVLGRGGARKTPIGWVPDADDLYLEGLNVSKDAVNAALAVSAAEWRTELPEIAEDLKKYGERLPAALTQELSALAKRLEGASS